MEKRVTADKILGVISPVLIYYAIQAVGVYIGYIVMVIYLSATGHDKVISTSIELYQDNILVLNLFASAVAIPVLVYFFYSDCKKEKNSPGYKSYEKISSLKYLLIVPFGIFSMMAANYFVTLLSMFMPSFMTESYEKTQEIIFGSGIVIQILTAVLIAPIAEELVFRGLVYSRLKRICNTTLAAIISAVAFGIYHWNWIQLPYAFIIGILAVFVYEKYQSIFAPIIFHASANLFSVILAYLVSVYSESAGSKAADLSFMSTIIALIEMIGITAVCAVAFGYIIHKNVNAKEIKQDIGEDMTQSFDSLSETGQSMTEIFDNSSEVGQNLTEFYENSSEVAKGQKSTEENQDEITDNNDSVL